MSIAVFYASNKGFAANAAKKIAGKLGVADVFDVKETPVKKMADYDSLVLVVATHKKGDIQNDLAAQIEDFKALDWSKKTVGIVGLGDGKNFSETFNNAMGKIYDIVEKARVVGFVEDKGYEYKTTESLRNGKFVGLPLDEANQSGMTDARIDEWVAAVKADL